MAIHMVQEVNIQIDSKELLMQYLNVVIPTTLDSLEEIAIMAIDHTGEDSESHLPTWHGDKESLPVIRISGWYFEKDTENSYFNGYEPSEKITNNRYGLKPLTTVSSVITRILEILGKNEESWNTFFLKSNGDGFNVGFNKRDGGTDIGYQITAGRTYPEEITISLIHMYYGK